MKLELPCFDDAAIDELVAGLPSPAVVSIRGVKGSGKTVVAERLLGSALEAEQASRIILLNDSTGGREFLNQATGTGIDLLPAISDGLLAIDVLEEYRLRELFRTFVIYPDVDLVVIDSIEELQEVDNDALERVLAWFSAEMGISVVCTGTGGAGDPRPYADLTIDLEQLSGEEDFWYADSVLTIGCPETDEEETRALRIDGYRIKMWEAT